MSVPRVRVVVSTSLMSPTCCHDMSQSVTMSRVPCHKSHSICQSDADCNNTLDEGETSCFNPLFVNGLSFLLTSLLSHYLPTPHVSPEIAMLCISPRFIAAARCDVCHTSNQPLQVPLRDAGLWFNIAILYLSIYYFQNITVPYEYSRVWGNLHPSMFAPYTIPPHTLFWTVCI